MNETFSEADIGPSPEAKRRARRELGDRAAATVAAIAVGLVVGGMLALGACAAPMVFEYTPAPFSGTAMGGAFARFDRLAMGAACVAMGAEVVRTYLARRDRQRITVRARRLIGIGLAAATALMGLSITPAINELHAQGARRHEGEQGQRLDAIHKRAEMVGRVEVVLGLALIGLHVFTLRRPSDDDEDDDAEAAAPAPPGPRDDA